MYFWLIDMPKWVIKAWRTERKKSLMADHGWLGLTEDKADQMIDRELPAVSFVIAA